MMMASPAFCRIKAIRAPYFVFASVFAILIYQILRWQYRVSVCARCRPYNIGEEGCILPTDMLSIIIDGFEQTIVGNERGLPLLGSGR